MENFYNPGDKVESELNIYLNRLYPTLKETGKTISFSKSKEHNVICEATVTYYFEKSSSISLLQYKERSTTNGYEQYWYCRSDWKD